MSDEYEVFETDIAIVGMAARVPGARTVAQFWENVKNGVEAIRFYTPEELVANGELPENLRKKNYVPAAAPLDGMEMFDGEFWGFSPKECAILDPQHRHFMECCWEALEHAGHPPERFDAPIGVFGGAGQGLYLYFNLCTNPDLMRDVGMFLLRHTGNDKDFLTTRVSYLLNLRGPSVNVVTACSTSLVSVHMACQSLIHRECDLALAGGVTVVLPHHLGYLYEEGEVLSPDGHCHAFDHRAKGTIFGSGCTVVALRRLEDALDDGDLIHAVIRGSAINNDGSSKVNYLAPSVDGQAACMVEAYNLGGVDPRTIEYVECHGTGTYLGDPIEITALTQAFRTGTPDKGFCRVGSVKTNIGHLDTAAGVAGLIKATMALKEGVIPKTLNFEKPNPTIDFENSPFRVADRLIEWPAPRNHPRRAAVNSLGVGGTNAHVVVQEPPARAESAPATRPVQLFTLSARNLGSLDEGTKRLAAHLRAHPELPIADVAWTLHYGRREFEKRRVFAASSLDEAIRILEEGDPRRIFTHSAPQKTSLAFMLPGGGAQYARMGVDLYEREPVFREHLDKGLDLLRRKHGIDLRPMLFAETERLEEANADLEKMPHQLPAIFLVSYAMAQLLKHWGVEPSALIGHSLGENTAACLAGVMKFEDCLGLVVLRGRLFEKTARGAMLSVSLPPDQLAPHLDGDLDVSVLNAPDVTVVSGTPEAIDRLAKKLEALDDVEARKLAIPTAAHSRLLDPILEEFGNYLRSIELRKPSIPFVSNRTGTWITDAQATDPDYWVGHLRNTVRFADGVATILEGHDRVLIECGPGRALSSLARQHPAFRKGHPSAFPSMRHRDEEVDDVTFFTATLGRVWAAGADFDWKALWPDEERQRVELPTYAWSHKPYFIKPGKVQVEDAGFDLQKIQELERFGWRPTWKPALADPREDGERHTWLIFMDQAGVGRRLRERLQNKGQTVIAVYEGDAFYKRSETEYSLSPERGKEGYSALISDLMQSGKAPDRIVHLWLLEAHETYRPGSSLFHHRQERGFFSLFFLAQALSDESVPAPIHLTVIENGLAAIGDESVPAPDKATVLGPVKVIPRELPGVTASLIDVQLPRRSDRLFGGTLRQAIVDPFGGKRRIEEALDALANAVEDDLQSPPRNAMVALRNDRRFEEVYEPQRLIAPTEPPLREGAVILITGGLGGLGLTMAEHLARRAKAKLVLLSRSPVPPREHWAQWMRQHGAQDRISKRLRRVLDVEEAGGEVMVVSADVTNLEEMREALAAAETKFGAVTGVLHTAGVIDDQLLSMKTQASVEEVFTPKIQGTMVLDELFKDRALDFFVLFSSTSSVIAPAGQVDYVAANAFLNSFAQSRAFAQSKVGANTRYVAIDWGIWNEVGMAAEAITDDPMLHAGEVVGEQPRHPLLDARVRDARGETVLTATYSPEKHWVLGGHRTKAGHPLVVGTGYLELAHAALRANGENGPFEIEDLFFIRPLAVADGEKREVRVKLRPTQRGYAFEVRSKVDLDGRTGWELHAQAHLALHPLDAPAKVPLRTIDGRCDRKRLAEDPAGMRTPQERHLRFGPRWRVLRKASFGAREGLAHLALPERFAGETKDFALHPALLDIATGWAMDLIEGYQGDSLWVPVSYERVRVHGALPASICSWVRSHGENDDESEFVFFDVTLTDPRGEVLLEVDKLALRKIRGEVDFTRRTRPSPQDVELEPRKDHDREPSPAEIQLERNLERGILPAEGSEALERVLAGPRLPQVIVSSLDLPGLLKQVEHLRAPKQEGGDSLKLSRPDLESEYVEPRTDIERTLVGFWQELLGVDLVGVKDSFFDLGGHSLIAVRLFAKVKKAYQVDFPISVLFEAPTIERCAELIQETIGEPATPTNGASANGNGAHEKDKKKEAPKTRYTHLVAMHPGDGGPKTPFFLVAGMFGNVLNLRHLAHLMGTDRRFYGLQARGLYGDQKPHETFEEMAEAYIAEMRTVQPHGPYFLGGFSGGGITAYEMAQQLRAAGEEVALLVMLDTPMRLEPAKLTLRDRALMQVQQLKSKGPAYVAEWAQRRWEWEMGKLKKRFDDVEPDRAPDEFHNEAIEQAFRGALTRYEVKPWPGVITMMRPPIQVAFDLGNGRLLDRDREYIIEDNGWGPYVKRVDIYEVPGDHDSMVLEPNVRVLVRKLREVVEDVEAKMRQKPVELLMGAAE